MTWLRRRWRPLAVLIAAAGLLIASFAWVAGSATGWSPSAAMMGPGGAMMGPGGGMMGPGGGMMGSYMASAGDGPVDNVDGARRAAGKFADRWGLTVGEVMQFDNGFYVELVDRSENLATEVLVDPRSGAVQIEFGPAMMWNTAYGMHPGAAAPRTVDPERARAIADKWLGENRPGENAAEPDAFPGYYTLHTLRGGQVTGMLSVNATNGAVWYHSWHGRFIA